MNLHGGINHEPFAKPAKEAAMPFQLRAFVIIPDCSRDANGDPIKAHRQAIHRLVPVGTFELLEKAQEAAEKAVKEDTPVFLDPPDNRVLMSPRQIVSYRIDEVT